MSHKVDVTQYHGKTTEELSKLHTGTLMNIRKAAYVEQGCQCCPEKHVSADEAKFNTAQWQLRQAVQDVLKTREHIPTKAQKREARQQAAKKGK